VIFLGEVLFNYLMMRILLRCSRGRTAIAAVVIVVDLLVLAYFKYFEFLVGNSVGLIAPDSVEMLNLAFARHKTEGIPPGISFYTFQMIAFLVDTIRGGDRKIFRLSDYLNFASFFPQIIAGPIERRADLFPQIRSFRLNLRAVNVEAGLQWLFLGLFMKMVLSDNLSRFIQYNETDNAYIILLSIYLFGLKIYCDFAGYSFIALGIARALGIKLTLNFNAPYTATNIQDFWRRWHVTLSNWFRDYVYFPLGGSRSKWVYANVVVVFAICGLWHGAGWNFVIWGAYHGALMGAHRLVRGSLAGLGYSSVRQWNWLGWLLTFSSSMFGWLFFMETDFQLLRVKLGSLVTPLAYSAEDARALIAGGNVAELATLGVALFLTTVLLVTEHIAVWKNRETAYYWLTRPWASRMMVMAVVLMHARTPSQFIYFDF